MFQRHHANGDLLHAIYLIREKPPCQKEVPTFAKARVDVFERHLLNEHDATFAPRVTEPEVNTIKKAIDRGAIRMQENDVKAAPVFCFCPNLSFRTADNAMFVQAYGQPLSRKHICTLALNLPKNRTIDWGDTFGRNLKLHVESLCLVGPFLDWN